MPMGEHALIASIDDAHKDYIVLRLQMTNHTERHKSTKRQVSTSFNRKYLRS